MSNPSGVDPNAVIYCSLSFTSGNAGELEHRTLLAVSNSKAGAVIVGCWIVMDGTLIDSVPLSFLPGQTRQEFTSYFDNLPAGYHRLDFYIGAAIAGLTTVFTRMTADIVKA